MGKQIEFYMHPEDEGDFLALALSHAGAVLLANVSLAPEPQALACLPTSDEGVISRNQVFLWKLGDPLSWHLVVRGEGTTPTRTLYYLDQITSWVIEFDRSTLVDAESKLTRGRLWVQMSVFQNGVLVHKSHDLEVWYNQLVSWIRRRYRRLKSSRPAVYVSPNAERLVGSPGAIVDPG